MQPYWERPAFLQEQMQLGSHKLCSRNEGLRYRVAVENTMVLKLLSLADKMSPLPTALKADFAYWVVSKTN